MFNIARKAEGRRGSFVSLVHLDSDDFAVIIRYPDSSALRHLYVGPDYSIAEEVFTSAANRVTSGEDLR
jgi:hypothetical protein